MDWLEWSFVGVIVTVLLLAGYEVWRSRNDVPW
jgi:hypothetical protein